jgi:hypothetical protein
MASATAAPLPSGDVLIVGGGSPAELFDPSNDAFTTLSSGGSVPAQATAAPLPDGQVLIAGGAGSPERGAVRSGHERVYFASRCWGHPTADRAPDRGLGAARATLERGTVTYARGTASTARLILRAVRAVRPGRYTLVLTRTLGHRRVTMQQQITIP